MIKDVAFTGNGIAFEVEDTIYESATCKSASLRDPEGNRIRLNEISASRRVE